MGLPDWYKRVDVGVMMHPATLVRKESRFLSSIVGLMTLFPRTALFP